MPFDSLCWIWRPRQCFCWSSLKFSSVFKFSEIMDVTWIQACLNVNKTWPIDCKICYTYFQLTVFWGTVYAWLYMYQQANAPFSDYLSVNDFTLLLTKLPHWSCCERITELKKTELPRLLFTDCQLIQYSSFDPRLIKSWRNIVMNKFWPKCFLISFKLYKILFKGHSNGNKALTLNP